MKSDMKIVDKELIPIYETSKGEKVVFARELHKAVLTSTRFNDWIQRNMLNIGFVEDKDFYSFMSKTSGRPSQDFVLTLDTAKHIAMIQRNEIGMKIRQKFINLEKRVQQQAPGTAAEMLLKQAELMVQYEKRINNLESKAAAAHHRIDNFDKIDTIGDKQQRLNKMVRLYAANQGLTFQQAWRNFKGAFNTAYRTNLTLIIENYKLKHNIQKLSVPEYLAKIDRLDDAIRVADKLLNTHKQMTVVRG